MTRVKGWLEYLMITSCRQNMKGIPFRYGTPTAVPTSILTTNFLIQGHSEMCSLLLEHGAEVDHQAKNGLAALHLAAQEDRVPVAQLLVKNGAEVSIEVLSPKP